MALACVAVCLLCARMAGAESAVCILPADAKISGTPCTDAVNAFDGKHTLIRLNSCTQGILDVNVVFQQDPSPMDASSTVGGYQTGVVYDPETLGDPLCKSDPSNFLHDLLGEDCPGIIRQTGETVVFVGEADVTSTSWPNTNPNFIMLNLKFSLKSLSANTSTPLYFLTSHPAKQTMVVNPDTVEIDDVDYSAVVTCAPGPVIADNQDGDATMRTKNDGAYDVDVIPSPGSSLTSIQVRACSRNANCGDIADWTELFTGSGITTLSQNWNLPDALWQVLPTGTSYISLRATDSGGTTAQAGPLFYIKKKVLPSAPSGLIAISTDNGVQLSWNAPAQNTDGSALANLAGYHVYVPASCDVDSASRLDGEMIPVATTHFKVPDASITPFRYFVVTAMTQDGIESGWSECVSALDEMQRGIAGTVVRPETSGGTVKNTGYPLVGMPGFTVQIMAGETEVGTAVTGDDGSFLIPLPLDSQDATVTVRIVIPEDSGFMAKSGSFFAGKGVRDAATIPAKSDGVTNAGVFRLSSGPTAGDVNCDGVVDIADAVSLKNAYGKEQGTDGYRLDDDINGDEVVDISDFVLLKQVYGQDSGSTNTGACTGH